MSNITVKFIGKEYSIPQDVLTYIDLLDFTDSVQKQLASTFVRKLRNEIAKDNIGLLGDEDLATEIEQQVGKFIAKLCDNGIFTRTINDYLKNNKGYQLYSDVNKAALEKMKSLLIQEMDAWQAGYENAVNKAESHVTGMGFSIWSSSFVNHAIYAAMEASTLNKQSKEAESQYQKDMNDLHSRLESQYGGEKSNYINNTYIPNMEAALTVFAYELLDKYVADLIASSKFDSKTLDYVDIGRSNDLLKNLTLSNNKQAILENAFAACPYNIAVYMQAMKYDLLDYDSFQTAKVFKQDHHILSFFRESWGEVSFPTKFNINYHCINVWASLTGKTTADLLRGLTEQYATGIVKAYSRVADIMADQSACRKIIGELREDAILSGASICVGKAREYVEPIVNTSTWEQLTEKCGHTDLLSRIKKCFPSVEELQSKKDFDRSVTEQLAARFEDARKELAEQIEARRAEEERQRLEREKQKAEQARIQAEKKAKRTAAVKKGAKRTLIVVGSIVAACIALVIAGIIFLFATDKPIDDDFSQSYEDSLHNLTYCVPENWEYSADESSDNESWYTRYDNWGNFLGAMVVSYEGDTPVVTVDSVVAEFKRECSEAKSVTENIGGQDFTVITFELESADATPFFYNIYVSEEDYSVFYISFIFVEESNEPDVFNEIVWEIAFEDYVNPKEGKYNEAISLMSAGKYVDALSVFTELKGYKDSADLIAECQTAIYDDTLANAKELINKGKYHDAIEILEELGDYNDSLQQLKIAKYGYANLLMNDGSYVEAADVYEELGDYEDSIELYKQARYSYALSLMASESYDSAITIFDELGDFSSAQEKAHECKYIIAKNYVNSYDYDAAKNQFMSISGYKDSDAYVRLIDNIISKVYYNDEYRGTHYIWVVSRIDTASCTEVLNFYECRDDLGLDDEFVDYYQGHNVQWKTSGTKIFASSDGQAAENGYTLYDLSAGRNILTSQYISTDGEAKVVDTYKLMPDGRAQYIKEEWVSYLENNEGTDAWKTAEATVEIIDDDSNVEETSDGIAFRLNGLTWHLPNGWDAELNADATVALVTFSEGTYWGDTDRVYISYEGQYLNLTEYMNKNKTNGTFSRISVDGCSEAYICYEGLLDENDFESNTAYVICRESVFKVSYVADNGWFTETQVEGILSLADFSSYTYE